jgi:hypothetical protein
MATILIDGLAIEAVDLVCEPLPGDDAKKPYHLRVRSHGTDYSRFAGAVPVVFPFDGKLYYGSFVPVSRVYRDNGEEECEFVSDGKVTPCLEPRRSPFEIFSRRRS